MPKLTIDNIMVEVPPGTTVLQACELAGKEIPRFCYHERLSIAGNCRMCLVEMENSPKPIASCAYPAADNMVIRTDTEKVAKARKGVLEFLLINHPLDCPICDQGGECDLQDQTLAYGYDRSRYNEQKRAVTEKNLGPLIRTHMTRCIQCTRCVRFLNEVAGTDELGAFGRGENMEIDTTLANGVTSELSGNIIDLCPVGALTSRPYAYVARPWELVKTETIDVMDAVGAWIRVDTRGPEVLRILPRINDDINEEWIADKSRFACDGLKRQRLDRPYLRKDGVLQECTWDEAFLAISNKLKKLKSPKAFAAIAGDMADCESIYALKSLLQQHGSDQYECRQDGAALDPTCRSGYLFNTTLAGLAEADACLLIGTNPRWEAPLINARLRQRYLHSDFYIAGIGPEVDLTYPVDWLGNDPSLLTTLLQAKKSPVLDRLQQAKHPIIIVGMGALTHPDGAAILHAAQKLAEKCGAIKDEWHGFNVLHTAASRVGGLELGFTLGPDKNINDLFKTCEKGSIDMVYLLGADEIPMEKLGKAFVIYQGHHGDKGAHRADVILPGAAYTEKSATYVNMEGRVQRTLQALFPPGQAREDWTIIRALSAVLGQALPFNSIDELRHHMQEHHTTLQHHYIVHHSSWTIGGKEGKISDQALTLPITNYYRTDPISRASLTMAECTRNFIEEAHDRVA